MGPMYIETPYIYIYIYIYGCVFVCVYVVQKVLSLTQILDLSYFFYVYVGLLYKDI